ncbi:MAG: serine/threonine-protein kinase [Lysobacteraceae bacterium]
MPFSPDDFKTGGALQGKVASSLLASRDAAAALKPGDTVGLFRIVRELGRGGMAVVYLAERADGEYRQQVALKWMQAAAPGVEGEALFRRERQALADLRHPHIARLLDGGRGEDGRPWFAMEYIEGERLDDHCVNAALPLRERLQLFLQLCAAVAFAHARGVIHRDIKPSNVLVDADGSVKLLDFGIARLLDQGDALGDGAYTPGFASPEQLRREPATVASDIYQLGRLLGCLLSADREELATLAQPTVLLTDTAAASGAIENHRANLPLSLPADLSAILRQAQAELPGQRYASVDAFADDVRAFLAQRPVSARPSTAAYRARRFLQRHPLASVASVVALVLLIGMATWFSLRLRDERDLARQQRDRAEEQVRIANATLAFLREDLLSAADPQNNGGRDLTVRETLDRAAEKVGDRFADTPLEEAAVRLTLADVYQGLGELQLAESQAAAGVAAAARSDADSAHALGEQIRLSQAMAVAFQRRIDDALAILPQAPAGDSGDPRLEETYVRAEMLRSNYVLLKQQTTEAEAIAARAVARARRLKGEEDPLYMEALFYRATPLRLLGRNAEALDILRQVERFNADTHGEEHVRTADIRHLIGTTLRAMGRSDEAESSLRQVLALRESVYGPNHPKTLSSQRELATALQDLARYDEACALFQSLVDHSLHQNGEDHRNTLDMRNNLALCLSRAGRHADAEREFAAILAIAARTGSSASAQMITPLNNLGILLNDLGRHTEAETRYREAMAMAATQLPAEDWMQVALGAGLGAALDGQGRCADADVAWEAAEALLQRIRQPDHPQAQRFHETRRQSAERRAAAGHASPDCAAGTDPVNRGG